MDNRGFITTRGKITYCCYLFAVKVFLVSRHTEVVPLRWRPHALGRARQVRRARGSRPAVAARFPELDPAPPRCSSFQPTFIVGNGAREDSTLGDTARKTPRSRSSGLHRKGDEDPEAKDVQ